MQDNAEKICYIRQENRGLGGARNTGMQCVETDYVSFLDSDDWLMPQYVERLAFHLEKVTDRKPEIIMMLPEIFHEGSRTVKDWYDKELFESVFPESGMIINPQEKAELYRFEVNQCRKVLKMDFVRKINFSFREKVKWEDIYPHFYLLSKSTACMGIGDSGFYYRIGSSSQITASRGADRLDLLTVFGDLLRYVQAEERQELYFPVMRILIRFSIWGIRMADTEIRKLLVNEIYRLFKKLPSAYYKALKKEVINSCSKADARQYLLFVFAVRYKVLNFIFYDYLWQDIGEKLVKKLLGAGERVA